MLSIWKNELLTHLFHPAETKYSSLARTESGNEQGLTSNGTSNAKTDTRYQQPTSNGVAKIAVPPQTSAVVTQAGAALNNVPFLRISKPAENGDVKIKTEREL